MGILFWYIFRQYSRVFMLCMTAALSIYLVVDFFEKLRRFLREDVDLVVMLTYFLYRIPDIAFQLVPLAALTATILTLGFMNKNLEVTAMRSCGVSPYQIASPFLALGVVVSSVLFSFTAVLIPISNTKAEFIRKVIIEKKPQALSLASDGLWLRLGQDALLRIDSVEKRGTLLKELSLFRVGPSFQLEEIVEADKATFSSPVWLLNSAARRQVSPDGQVMVTRYDQLPIHLALTPEDFRTWLSRKPENMTLRQLRAYIHRLERDGHSADRLSTDYWGRIAFSTLTVVMTIIGLALGLHRTGTRGITVAKGLGQALGIGFLCWSLHSLGIVLGRNGALLPIISGWIAVVMFLAVGVNMFLKVR